MPVTATWLTDVSTGNSQPLVAGRIGEHPLEQLTVAGLELGLLPQLTLGGADSRGKRVANRLQVAQAQRPRLA
jgi:hypothetical protein